MDIQCYELGSSKERCLKLNCGYDENKENSKCYPVQVDTGCKFENNQCTISSPSTEKTCSIIFDEQTNNIICKERAIECSDLNQDSTNCPKAQLEEANKKCSYDSSRSNNKCFEVLIEDGCTYDNENKECTGVDASNGKICELDLSGNPGACKKRNAQCSDFDNDSESCPNVKLPDKSKKCSYSSNKCVEEQIEAKCTYESGQCQNSLPLKIKCVLNNDKNGCEESNVECSDFENDQTGCNDAIISNSNKKCNYESGQCTEVFKGCSDFSQ